MTFSSSISLQNVISSRILLSLFLDRSSPYWIRNPFPHLHHDLSLHISPPRLGSIISTQPSLNSICEEIGFCVLGTGRRRRFFNPPKIRVLRSLGLQHQFGDLWATRFGGFTATRLGVFTALRPLFELGFLGLCWSLNERGNGICVAGFVVFWVCCYGSWGSEGRSITYSSASIVFYSLYLKGTKKTIELSSPLRVPLPLFSPSRWRLTPLSSKPSFKLPGLTPNLLLQRSLHLLPWNLLNPS